jgi:hypothetical protein
VQRAVASREHLHFRDTVTGHWIAVASAEHVRLGQAGGFMQVSHGKAAPL